MQDTPKNFHKKLLGSVGEKKAKKYLVKNGYKILDVNYKTKIGEIDIVFKDKDAIVFAEVKCRSNENYGYPSDAVNFYKQRKYKKVAEEYLLYKFQTVEVSCRFDVIEVIGDKINHIINAFCF